MSQQQQCGIVKLRDTPLVVALRCDNIDRYVVEVDEIDPKTARVIITSADGKRESKVVQKPRVFDVILNKTNELGLAKYVNKVIMSKESDEGEEISEPPVRVDAAVWPLGVADAYYYLTREGWCKIFRSDDGIDIVQADVEIPKWAPKAEHVLNAVYHLPPCLLDLEAIYSTDEILEQIAQYIRAYVTMREEYVAVAAVWILLTYVRHALPYAELLFVRKSGYGSGGTTAAEVALMASARPVMTLVAPTPAPLIRLFHFLIPTVLADEYRDEIRNEIAEMFKLVAESAYRRRNITVRLEENRPVVYRLYANVIVVDTAFKMTSLSSARRAWIIRVERDPHRETDLDAAEDDAFALSYKLYSWGLVWPLIAHDYIKYAHHQGLGAIRALKVWLEARGIKSRIVDMAYEVVSRQLTETYESAIITDPVRRIAAVIEDIVDEVKRSVQDTNIVPQGWHLSNDGNCVEIYLETLRRKVRERLRYLHEITVQYERDASGNLVESVKQSQWYKIDPEIEPLLRELKRFLEILRTLNYNVVYDGNRNYKLRVCF